MKKIVFLALFIGILLILFFVFVNTPSKGLTKQQQEQALTNILGRKPVLTDNSPTGNVTFKGKYVTFLYPAAARIYVLKINGQVKKDNWNLDSLNFDLDNPRATVLVTVSQAPSGVTSLDDYPSIKLRQIQPGLYQGKDITVANQSGLDFEKSDTSGFEETAFFYISGRIYVFSFQGSDKEGIEKLFNQIIASVKFLP